ncbi:MAG: hypothetical protein QM767_15500 [Anaeromyxobacter sp.]
MIEASSYAEELAGGEKRKESLRGLLGAATVLFRSYERLYVQFEEPISLRALALRRLGERTASLTIDEAWEGEAARSSTTILAPGARDAPAGAKRQLVQAVGNWIAYGISRAVTITPVGLVSAALLSHARRGMSAREVEERVELLRYIAAEGGARFARDLAGAPSDPRQPGPIGDAVRRLSLQGLVRVELAAGDTIYQVVDDKRMLLDYHRNAVIHRYVAPALVALAACSARADEPLEATRARALGVSRLFKLEFMYRVGATFDLIFDQNVAFLERVGALARTPEGGLRAGPQAERLTFLAEFMRPYLEAYRLTLGTALAACDAHTAVDRKALVREAQERGRAAFLSGQIAAREALNKATIGNAVEWLLDQQLLVEADDDGKVRLGRGGPDALRQVLGGQALLDYPFVPGGPPGG